MQYYFNIKLMAAIGIFIFLFTGCGTYGRKSSITNPNVLAEETKKRSTSFSEEYHKELLEKKENVRHDSTSTSPLK